MILTLTSREVNEREMELLRIAYEVLNEIRKRGGKWEEYFQWFAHNAQQSCVGLNKEPIDLNIFGDRLRGYEDLIPVIGELVHGLTYKVGSNESVLNRPEDSVY